MIIFLMYIFSIIMFFNTHPLSMGLMILPQTLLLYLI